MPLSLAFQQLDVAAVDFLKVDVEGDELAVLHGIDDEDWRKIRQVRGARDIGNDANDMETQGPSLDQLVRSV